jgi:hypothetical protein
MKAKNTIIVKDTEISIIHQNEMDYISLTDMVKNFEGGGSLIEQWLKNKDTVIFLGVWEHLNNPGFNSPEFEGIKNESGRNSFYLSARKWIEKTNAIGFKASAGRYGGTFAHKDIAFEFGSWLSPEFKLYLIKEFQRLKDEENERLKLEWNLTRTLAKVNYQIHTDAIKEHLIPPDLKGKKRSYIYAGEADLLNLALFGKTALDWRTENPELNGNIRDYVTIEQLVVLSNLESINSLFINQGMEQGERLMKLNIIAIQQMKSLLNNQSIKKLK